MSARPKAALHRLTACGLFAACWTSSSARAARANIQWEAPAGCPDTNQVRAAIDAMIGDSSANEDASDLVARAVVTAVPGRGFVLQVRLQSGGAAESKTLGAETCTTLADAYAVIVAFALDPEIGGHLRSPKAVADPPSLAASTRGAPIPATPADSSPPRAVAPGIRGLAGPLFAMGAGNLPFPAFGVGARIALEHGVRWELAGLYWPEQSTTVSVVGSPLAGARVKLESLQPSVCAAFARGAIGLCAGSELGVMQAAGTGVPRLGSGSSWWLALEAGLSARVTLGPAVNFRARIDFGVPLFRPRFVLESVGEPATTVGVYTPAAIFAVLGLEPEIQIFSTDPPPNQHVSR